MQLSTLVRALLIQQSTIVNVNLLIDSLVQQTTILIAQLATAAGGRPSLAHTANQVFVNLVGELKRQGVGNKVIADMFGLALRTYHSKVKRLEESSTYGGRSLWEAVLEFIQEKQSVLQTDVLMRFRNDEYLTVKSVLTDLVDSGMVFRTGRGGRTTYRAASPDEVQMPDRGDEAAGVANLVWVAVHRLGPTSAEQLLALVPMEAAKLDEALSSLLVDGRIKKEERNKEVVYSCDGCFISEGDPNGWEAAVFDHYQAMVTAITTKLGLGPPGGAGPDHIGGSTYSYFVWDGHPMEQEVLGFLKRMREQAVELRQRVAAFNENQDKSQEEMTRVIAYVGQTVLEPELGAAGSLWESAELEDEKNGQ